jgi:UDP-glucose 4-epimerase
LTDCHDFSSKSLNDATQAQNQVTAMKFSRILVTGGAGFVGSHLIDELLENGYHVTVLDDFSSGRIENIAKHLNNNHLKLVRGDMRRKEIVKEAISDAEAVIHLAALIDVKRSLGNPFETHDVNVNGTLTILEEARKRDVRKFIFASSAAVYGDTNKLPLKEETLTRPISPYGASKASAENYCIAFYRSYGLKTCILRYFNVYGSDRKFDKHSGVITSFLINAMNHKPLIIYGDGEQTRDFIHVGDVVNASLTALENDCSAGEILNICTGVPITMNHLAQIIKEILRHELQIVYRPQRKGDILYNYGDPAKAKKTIRFYTKISLVEGLNRMINHMSKSNKLPEQNGRRRVL